MAEFEQLAADVLVTPKWVLPASWSTSLRHSAGSGGRPGPRRRPNAATMDQRPMPAEDGGWLHQEQSTG